MPGLRRKLLRLAPVFGLLVVVAVLFTWIVVPSAERCRWGVSIWDGDTRRAGYVSVPCSYTEREVRAELEDHPAHLVVVPESGPDEAP